MTDCLLVHKSSLGVLRLTLNRPEKRNALNADLIARLNDELQLAENDPSIRVVVLQGAGGFFCSGADLRSMQSMIHASYEANYNDAMALASMLNRLSHLNKPVVACVDKMAFGGAIGLIACADIAVADEGCQFALSEVKLGLAPATISPYVISTMGERACRRFFLTGEIFNANTAVQYGLLHEYTTSESLKDRVDEICEQLIRSGPQAISACKKLIREVSEQPVRQELIENTAHLLAKLRTSDEGQEGLKAFLERRAPDWHTLEGCPK